MMLKPRISFRNQIAVALCAATLVCANGSGADTPRGELLRLVPDDAGICMVVQNLRNTLRSVRESPFVEQFQASALGTALRNSPETKKLRDVEHYFKVHFDVGWERLVDDLVGDAVVLAYWPGPPGKPEEEQGIILVRARDARLLADVLARLPALAHPSGNPPPTESRKHDSGTYSAWSDGKRTTFTYVNGPVAAVTHHEELLKRVISRDRSSVRGTSPIMAGFQRLGFADAVASVWFNPRAFDAEVEHQTTIAPEVDVQVRRTTLAHWKAIEGVALSANVDRNDLEFSLSILVNGEKLPEASRHLLRPGQASELWSWFPKNCMLSVAGRIDTVGLSQTLTGFLDDKSRKAVRDALDRVATGSIGRHVEREVFPGLGPDWGFCVVPPPAEEKGWMPYFIAALKIQPGNQEPPLDRAIGNFLNGMAMLAVVAHNSSKPDAITLHTEMQDKVEVKYFVEEKNFPPGFRPAFAMKDGYLVVASSPAAIRLFRRPTADSVPNKADGETPLLRLSPAALRQYLSDRSDAIISHVAATDQIPLEEAKKRLSGLGEVLGLLENVEVTQRSTNGQFHFTLRIQTSHALRK